MQQKTENSSLGFIEENINVRNKYIHGLSKISNTIQSTSTSIMRNYSGRKDKQVYFFFQTDKQK